MPNTDYQICGEPATALHCEYELWFFARCEEHRAPEDTDWTPTEWDTPDSSVCRYRV